MPRGFKYSVDNSVSLTARLTAILCPRSLRMSQQRTVKITTLPATSLENRVINVTASSGKAEREVNDTWKLNAVSQSR